mgnify:CR=1 FL=1
MAFVRRTKPSLMSSIGEKVKQGAEMLGTIKGIYDTAVAYNAQWKMDALKGKGNSNAPTTDVQVKDNAKPLLDRIQRIKNNG